MSRRGRSSESRVHVGGTPGRTTRYRRKGPTLTCTDSTTVIVDRLQPLGRKWFPDLSSTSLVMRSHDYVR